MKSISDYWGGWFAGFAAGEGCFNIQRHNHKNPCTNYQCQFQLHLRADDKPILEEIRDTLEIGAIYDYPARINNSRSARPQAHFCVHAVDDCAELVKVFEKYPLRAKKQCDFEIWKQMLAEMRKPVGERNSDLLEYYYLKIQEVRKYEAVEELVKPKRIDLQLTIEFS